MKEANYSFSELIRNESFRRWVQGNASEQEKVYWDKWIMSNPENRTLATRAQKEIAGFFIRSSSQPARKEAWRHLQNKMNKSDRHTFIGQAALGTAAVALTSTLPRKILGANDRVRIGIIGCGERGNRLTGYKHVFNAEKKEVRAA